MEPNFFEWSRLVLMAGQIIVSGVGVAAIFVGLQRMKEAGARRDREIDVIAKDMQENTRNVGRALERQGEVLAELLRRGSPA